jgi:hypothetical protein
VSTALPGLCWTTASALRTVAEGGCVLDAPVVAVLPWVRRAAAQRAARLMLQRAGAALQVLAVQDDAGLGPVAIWNLAAQRTRGAFFIYTAEDAFAGRLWLRFALQALQNKPQAGLVAFNDGKWFGQLAGFGLVRRAWLAPLYGGSLFFPGYARHYGDTELTLIARQQDALAYHPHAVLVEVDHDKDGKPVDETDRALFRQRAAGGFDGRVRDAALLASFG